MSDKTARQPDEIKTKKEADPRFTTRDGVTLKQGQEVLTLHCIGQNGELVTLGGTINAMGEIWETSKPMATRSWNDLANCYVSLTKCIVDELVELDKRQRALLTTLAEVID